LALFQPWLEALGLLLLPSGLQAPVLFADHERPLLLILAQTLAAQVTILTREAELQTVAHFARGLWLSTAALRVGLSSRTKGRAFLNVDFPNP
jgi:hypothetical protein